MSGKEIWDFLFYCCNSFTLGQGGSGDPKCGLQHSSIWIKIRLHTENQVPRLSGSTLKVWEGGGVVCSTQSHQFCIGLTFGCDNKGYLSQTKVDQC